MVIVYSSNKVMLCNKVCNKTTKENGLLNKKTSTEQFTAHVHQCCRFQSYAKTVPSRMKLMMYVWTSIHDNGHVVTVCEVWL